jgi:hypothetical protein
MTTTTHDTRADVDAPIPFALTARAVELLDLYASRPTPIGVLIAAQLPRFFTSDASCYASPATCEGEHTNEAEDTCEIPSDYAIHLRRSAMFLRRLRPIEPEVIRQACDFERGAELLGEQCEIGGAQ